MVKGQIWKVKFITLLLFFKQISVVLFYQWRLKSQMGGWKPANSEAKRAPSWPSSLVDIPEGIPLSKYLLQTKCPTLLLPVCLCPASWLPLTLFFSLLFIHFTSRSQPSFLPSPTLTYQSPLYSLPFSSENVIPVLLSQRCLLWLSMDTTLPWYIKLQQSILSHWV